MSTTTLNYPAERMLDQAGGDLDQPTFESSSPSLFADSDLYLEESAPATLRLSSSASVQVALSKSRILSREGEQLLFKRLQFVSFRAAAIETSFETSRPTKKKRLEVARLRVEEKEIRDQIATANLRLVASIAAKLAKSPSDFDDYFSEGNAILMNCIEKFDYSRGFRFSTYATTSIQRHLYRVIYKGSKQRSVECVHDDRTLENIVGNSSSDEVSKSNEHAAAQAIISRMDQTLDEREKFIVCGRLGLDGSGQGKTFQHLGDHLGLSKERIRQLFHRGIDKLGQLADSLGIDSLAHE